VNALVKRKKRRRRGGGEEEVEVVDVGMVGRETRSGILKEFGWEDEIRPVGPEIGNCG
jgi:hypothetical protein